MPLACHPFATHRPPTPGTCHSPVTHLPIIGHQRQVPATQMPLICHSSATNGLAPAIYLPFLCHSSATKGLASATHLPLIGHPSPSTKPRKTAVKPGHASDTPLTRSPCLSSVHRIKSSACNVCPRAFMCVRFRLCSEIRGLCKASHKAYNTRMESQVVVVLKKELSMP